jgi:hypothetical protein
MKTNRNNTGRWLAVRDTKTGNSIVEAIIVDADAGRVRLQTGEHFGEARRPGEYEALEFLMPHERGAALEQALAAMNEPE